MVGSPQFRRWNELYIGVLLGIAGNVFVEALMGLVESFNVTIPPIVWLIELITSGACLAYLLYFAWHHT